MTRRIDEMQVDTLTRRWDRVLDDLVAYMVRELTPAEEEELANLVVLWQDRIEEAK